MVNFAKKISVQPGADFEFPTLCFLDEDEARRNKTTVLDATEPTVSDGGQSAKRQSVFIVLFWLVRYNGSTRSKHVGRT